MSAKDGHRQEAAALAATVAPCPLCQAAIAPTDERCPSCGLTLAGVYGRPGPFSQATFWWMAAGLAAVYLLTLLVVALAR